MELTPPRDRDSSSFEPQFIPKGQKYFKGFDDRIIAMYARGMSVRDIQACLLRCMMWAYPRAYKPGSFGSLCRIIRCAICGLALQVYIAILASLLIRLWSGANLPKEPSK